MTKSDRGLKSKLNGRKKFFERVNSEGRFHIDNIEDVPLGFDEKVKARCVECGSIVKIHKRTAYSHTCPVCGNFESSNEHLISKILDENNIEFIREYRIKYVYQGKQRYQMLDFYLPNYNIAIEHQGNQHYNPNNGLHNEDVVNRDKMKFSVCVLTGIELFYTYENGGLIFDQLSELFTPYGIKLNKYIGSKYPPADKQLQFLRDNPGHTVAWYTKNLGYGDKTFVRYLKMCGLVGLSDALVYLRWEGIPDEEFLDYLAHNGIVKAKTHFSKTQKTVNTHLNDLGYKNLYQLQLERKTIPDAYPDNYILDLIIARGGLKGAAESLGFKKYVLEHYLPKIGYKNYNEVLNKYGTAKQ